MPVEDPSPPVTEIMKGAKSVIVVVVDVCTVVDVVCTTVEINVDGIVVVATVDVTEDVDDVADTVTVLTVTGVGRVVVEAVTPMHEHALEYPPKPEQADAYEGYADGETVTCRFSLSTSGTVLYMSVVFVAVVNVNTCLVGSVSLPLRSRFGGGGL